MGNNGKTLSSEKLEIFSRFSDTMCNRDGGTMTSEAMYNLSEEEKPWTLESKATVDDQESFDAS